MIMLMFVISVVLSGLFSNLCAMIHMARDKPHLQQRLKELLAAAKEFERLAAANSDATPEQADEPLAHKNGDVNDKGPHTSVLAAGWSRAPNTVNVNKSEGITVLLPCYLPNEQHILAGTLDHLR